MDDPGKSTGTTNRKQKGIRNRHAAVAGEHRRETAALRSRAAYNINCSYTHPNPKQQSRPAHSPFSFQGIEPTE